MCRAFHTHVRPAALTEYHENCVDWVNHHWKANWSNILLVLFLSLLFAFPDPLYPLVFLLNSTTPRTIDILFQTLFYFGLLLFWLCFFHGIRQNARTFPKFYAPKIFIVGNLWFAVFYCMTWSSSIKLSHPTIEEMDEFAASSFLRALNILFYLLIIAYFLYLAILLLTAFTELRSMPYFDVRLKLQTFLTIFSLLVALLLTLLNSTPSSSATGQSQQFTTMEMGNTIETDIPFLRSLPFTYQSSSSAAFLSLFAIANLYVSVCAYLYHPSSSSLMGKCVRNPSSFLLSIIRLIILSIKFSH